MKLSAMTLGTVQLGMEYGIANTSGKPDLEKSFSILRTALEGGVNSLDTARAYGNSEEVIGAFLKTYQGERPLITTKIPHIPEDASVEEFVVSSVEASLSRLGVPCVDTVMLHSAGDVSLYGEKLSRAMKSLTERGYTRRVGVSVYTAEDIKAFWEDPVYTAVQIPMSILDQRLIDLGMVERMKDKGISVFVRSVFLQGLFFLNPDTVTDPDLKQYAVPFLVLLRELAAAEGMSLAQMALSFIRDTAGVDSLVLGAETAEQVKENLKAMNAPALSLSARSRIRGAFSGVNVPEIMKVLSRPKK